jgi:saccharopine dehydrogenase (NAD+, L-lysine forming)
MSFVKHCLESGAHYVDVSAHTPFLEAAEHLNALATERGRTAILSTGLAPGLTNLLGAHLAACFDRVERLDLFVIAGAGDVHGDAALSWIFDNLDAEIVVRERGVPRRVKSFGESNVVTMRGRERRAYRFGFPDQITLARTLNIPTVSTWLCFDSRFVASFMWLAARLGLGRLLRSGLGRGVATAVRVLRIGTDECAVIARAQGIDGNRRVVRQARLTGRREADVTGWVAAEAVQSILAESARPGVRHIETALEPARVFSALLASHSELELTVCGPHDVGQSDHDGPDAHPRKDTRPVGPRPSEKTPNASA